MLNETKLSKEKTSAITVLCYCKKLVM